MQIIEAGLEISASKTKLEDEDSDISGSQKEGHYLLGENH
jgi:hypothetical protein